jgi:hypothetical protein
VGWVSELPTTLNDADNRLTTADAHTHFTWTNASSLDALAVMDTEEHTVRILVTGYERLCADFISPSQLFSARSAKTFLDCGYTQCFGAASAKQRIDVAIRDAINNGDIVSILYLCGKLTCYD